MQNKILFHKILFISTLFDIVIIDQVVKWLVLRGTIPTFKTMVLDFTILWNKGIAFGIGLPFAFWIACVFILGYVMISFYKSHHLIHSLMAMIAAGLITGGAVSNSIDRVIHGAVLDFIDIHFWPVFNIADSAVVIGAVLLFFNNNFDKEIQLH